MGQLSARFLLKQQGRDDGSHVMNRMIFAQQISALEAFLADRLINRVMADKALGHYTHEKNPVACASGLAAIEVIESEGLLENARVMGEYAFGRMLDMMNAHRLIGDVRGLGLLMGMELRQDR